MEKPLPPLEEENVEANQQREPTQTHNLYLCNDISCQRILKTMLLQKFDDLKSHIVEDGKSAGNISGVSCKSSSLPVLKASTFFEDYLITIVKYLSQKKWKYPSLSNTDQEHLGATNTTVNNTKDDTTTNNSTKDETYDKATEENVIDRGEDNCNLLYLATALNLPGFIHVIFQWADTNPHYLLNKEVDCTAQDLDGYTPLVRMTIILELIESRNCNY